MTENKKFPISVLIVDDEPMIVEHLAQILRRRVSTLYTASNGQEGLECYKKETVDLIISDIDMPVMNGIDFLKQVRAHNRKLPFIFSTGLKSLDILVEAIELGITAFLPKPLQKQYLIDKIEKVARTKELELEVKNSNSLLAQYKTIVDASSIVSKTDPNGIITYVNDTFCTISGYEREELIGQPHNIVRDPAMPSNIFKNMWETIQAKKTWRGVVNNRAKNGNRYTVKSTITPILDAMGNIVEYIGLREDITENIRKEEKIRAERKKLDDILNHVDSIVALVSVADKLKFLNQKFFDIFAYRNFEEYKRQHECICDIFENKEGFLQQKMGELYWVEYMLQNPNQSHHAIMIDKKGNEREFSVSLQQINSDNNEFFVITMDDVTQLQQVKEEAKAAAAMKGEFLANMSHEIRTPMNGILGFAALLAKSELSGQQRKYLDIINNSTQTLLGIINDILDFSKLESGKFELDYSDINPFVEFDKIAQLFSAVMAEKQITFTVIIDPMISECIHIDLLRTQQVLSNLISNAVKFTPEQGDITFYIRLLEKSSGEARLRIGVQDSGIGIAHEQQKKIFEAFSQADSSITRKFGGTGLGLSISSHLVSLMGGRLGVESEEGKGSDFYFELNVKVCPIEHSLSAYFQTQEITILKGSKEPCVYEEQVKSYFEALRIPYRIIENGDFDAYPHTHTIYVLFCHTDPKIIDALIQKNRAAIVICNDKDMNITASNLTLVYDLEHNLSALYNALIRTAQASVITDAVSASGNRSVNYAGKVLVAEDNKVNQMLIMEFLQQYGLDSDIVENGRHALDKLDQETYNLILMDVNMPIMGGIETVGIIKKMGISTPVVALTANAMEGDREKFLAAGFDNYLSKPIVIDQFEKILETYLFEGERSAHTDTKSTESHSFSGEILDYAVIKQALPLSDTILHKLLSTFLASSETSLSELREAIVAEDLKAIEHTAHYIKGGAGNLRLKPIEKLAGEIEKLSRSNMYAEYKELYAQMEVLIKKVQSEIKEHLDSHKS